MLTVPCYLAPSKIEGLGVFCHTDIRKGQVIWQHDPMMDVRLPKSKVAELPEHVQVFVDRYAYDDMRDPTMVVLESDEGRFMNHADAPNADFGNKDFGTALVDIPAGTEITCDYRQFESVLVFQPPRHKVVPVAA